MWLNFDNLSQFSPILLLFSLKTYKIKVKLVKTPKNYPSLATYCFCAHANNFTMVPVRELVHSFIMFKSKKCKSFKPTAYVEIESAWNFYKIWVKW